MSFKEVLDKMFELRDQGYDFNKVAVDRIKQAFWDYSLDTGDFELLSVNQSPLFFTAPIMTMEDKAIKGRAYLIDNNPVFKWAVGNARLRDPIKSPYRMFMKTASLDAIDPLIAATQAAAVFLKYRETGGFPQLIRA